MVTMPEAEENQIHKKLRLRAEDRGLIVAPPQDDDNPLLPLPESFSVLAELEQAASLDGEFDYLHVFARDKGALAGAFSALCDRLAPGREPVGILAQALVQARRQSGRRPQRERHQAYGPYPRSGGRQGGGAGPRLVRPSVGPPQALTAVSVGDAMPEFIVDFLKAIGISDPGDLGWVTILATFLISVVACWWFTPRTLKYSLRVGWADQPNARRLNQEPLANAGGLAIFCAVVLAVIAVTLFRRILLTNVQVQILSILLGGSLVMLAGFIDDQHGLPPFFRLGVQLIAALLLVGTGIRLEVGFGGQFSAVLSGVFTVIWVLAITNAINLIDGVDGLAGGVSFISSMSLLGVSAQFGSRAAASVLLASLAGAALGFLRHNFPPSKIIMGDSGAYFFGFVLAASALLGQLKFTTVFTLGPAVVFLLLIFLLPLFDTVQVIFRRLLRRQNPLSSPGQDHLHHFLMSRGLSQRRTTLILWAITLVTNVIAMWLQDMRWPVIVTTATGIVLLLGFVVWRRMRAHRKWMAKQESPPAPSA